MSKRILSIILLFVLTSLLFAMPVFADINLCPVCGEYHASFFKEDAGKMAYDMCKVVYGNDKGIFADLLNDVAKLDVASAGAGFNMAFLWSIIETIYNQLIVVGLMLVLVHAGMEISDLMQSDNLNPEKHAMILFKIALAVLVMNNGFEIMTFFAGLANSIFDKLTFGNLNITQALNADKCNYAEMAKAGIFPALGEILSLSIPWLVCQITNILTMAICYIRIIEIGAITMFAPIGMSDIGFKGQTGSGWKYLRRVFALFLQGSVIMAIQMVYTLLSALVSGNIITICTLNVVMIIVMFKSQSLANDVAGVR